MEGFREKLEEHVSGLFPGYAVRGLKSVGRNPDTGRFRTGTYEVTAAKNGASEKFFVKSFSDWFVKNRKDAINFTVKMSRKRQVNMPEIYGFYSDINSYIMEGVDGKPMSGVLAGFFSNPFRRRTDASKTEFLVREVARSIAFLQNQTRRGVEPFSYRSFMLEKNPELKRFIAGNKTLSAVAAGMEGRRIMMCRGYNDLKPGNILVSGRHIRFIDPGVFGYKWFFINPVAFSVGLQLTQRVPLFRGGLGSLRQAFYDEYLGSLEWKADPRLLEDMEMLKKCELLCYFTRALKSGVPIKQRVQIRLNIRSLRSGIRNFQRN